MKAIVSYMCSNLFSVFSLTHFDTDMNIFNELAPNNINKLYMADHMWIIKVHALNQELVKEIWTIRKLTVSLYIWN